MASEDSRETPARAETMGLELLSRAAVIGLIGVPLIVYSILFTPGLLKITYHLSDASLGPGGSSSLDGLLPISFIVVSFFFALLINALLRKTVQKVLISTWCAFLFGVVSIAFIALAFFLTVEPAHVTKPSTFQLRHLYSPLIYWMAPYLRPVADSGQSLYIMNLQADPEKSFEYGRLTVYFGKSSDYIARRITNPLYEIRYLSWSPSGNRLGYYALETNASQEQWSVHLIDCTGRARHIRARSAKPADALLWSPDGTKVSFVQPSGQPAVLDVTRKVQNHIPLNSSWKKSEIVHAMPFSPDIYWQPSWSFRFHGTELPRMEESVISPSMTRSEVVFAYRGVGAPGNRLWVLYVYIFAGLFGPLATVLGVRAQREQRSVLGKIGLYSGMFTFSLFTLAIVLIIVHL